MLLLRELLRTLELGAMKFHEPEQGAVEPALRGPHPEPLIAQNQIALRPSNLVCAYSESVWVTLILDFRFLRNANKTPHAEQRNKQHPASQVKLLLPKFYRADSALRSQDAGGVGVCAAVASPAFGCRLG